MQVVAECLREKKKEEVLRLSVSKLSTFFSIQGEKKREGEGRIVEKIK